MPGQLGVALITRKPLSAAFELDCDDVEVAPVMCAPGSGIDVNADDIDSMDFPAHRNMETLAHYFRSRGQISTRTAPMTKHAIIRTNPAVNEPVR